MKQEFNNAQEAFEYYYDVINDGDHNIVDGTKVLYNTGFYLNNPMDNKVNTDFRKWNNTYAIREWDWYLSGNPNGEAIAKYAPIWKNHMDLEGNVRSNYGWQWNRGSQLDRIIDKLHANKNTRQALLSIYDGKEIGTYQYDTPCTSSIHFQIVNDKLCMSVNMRSNDLWFGFCNDQFCFSMLQEMVAKELGIEIGWYYHFASNMHLYDRHLNKNN
tara:strand:+ start:240 stop:884 length:645 start_codon:yes stop_codon:yes gene_type:complete